MKSRQARVLGLSGSTINDSANVLLRTMVVLLAASTANAQPGGAPGASYRWTAAMSLDAGAHRNCGGPSFTDRNIEANGYVLRSAPTGGANQNEGNATMDLRPLNPDGSGRLSAKDKAGRTWYWDFESGSGPRKIRIRREDKECIYLWSPK